MPVPSGAVGFPPHKIQKKDYTCKKDYTLVIACYVRLYIRNNNNNNNKNRPPKMRKTRPAGEAQGQGVTVMASRVERGVLAFATS